MEREGEAALPLLIDDSLSLINRTGAHYIARDLVGAFADRGVVRRWRMLGAALPSDRACKVLGRLMLRELQHLGDAPVLPWPQPPGPHIKLFLDPLYVLRSRLCERDVVLCHDIGPLTHPALYLPSTARAYERAYAKILRERPGLVFVSHASRQAFAARFGSAFRLMQAIPLYLRAGSVDGPLSPVDGCGERFLLSVGALERRKNHLATIEAYAGSGLASRNVGLVICGSRGDAAAQVHAAASAVPGVRVLGYVDDAQLRWLYTQASAFVLPSLLEGFGMPALEAARYGLLPIVSRDSALHEAVGGLGLAVDPSRPDELARAMCEVVDLDPQAREALRLRLRAHASAATRERFLALWDELLTHETHAVNGSKVARRSGLTGRASA
jgi:glycosyltransferase involved in cell wall biosynthesis